MNKGVVLGMILTVFLISCRSDETRGLKGEYFNGRDFEMPVFERIDPSINFDFGDSSPGKGGLLVEPDNFSLRWTGVLSPPATGSYTLTLFHNDGGRLFIEDMDVPLIDWWYDGKTSDSGTVYLVRGQSYKIKVEIYEGGKTSQARLTWESADAGICSQVIPSSFFSVP